MKDSGTGVQGHSRSPVENAVALLTVETLTQQLGLSYDASYHAPRDETWVSASKAKNKHELAHQLLDLEVAQLTTVDASHRVVPSHLFAAKRNEGGPGKEDLLAAVRKFLEEHPEHNRTVIEQLMSDKGYSLVYTPPFCPDVQPIELLWAEVKRMLRIAAITSALLPKLARRLKKASRK